MAASYNPTHKEANFLALNSFKDQDTKRVVSPPPEQNIENNQNWKLNILFIELASCSK